MRCHRTELEGIVEMRAPPVFQWQVAQWGEEVSRDKQEAAPPGMALGSVWLMSRCDPVSAGNTKDSTLWKMSRMVKRKQDHKRTISLLSLLDSLQDMDVHSPSEGISMT